MPEVQFPCLSSSSSSNRFFSALSLASNLALYKENTVEPFNNSHSIDQNHLAIGEQLLYIEVKFWKEQNTFLPQNNLEGSISADPEVVRKQKKKGFLHQNFDLWKPHIFSC